MKLLVISACSALLVARSASVTASAVAQDSYSTRVAGETYECRELSPSEIKPPPELAPAPRDAKPLKVAEKPRLCRPGYGPLPIKHDAGPVAVQENGKKGAAVPPQNQPPRCVIPPDVPVAGCYWYARQGRTVCDGANIYAMTGFQSQENPFVRSDAADHSIGQLWAIDTNCGTTNNLSTVEIGWRKIGADPGPRLFVFRFDNGTPRCYIGQFGCADGGWVPYQGAVEVPGLLIGFADQYHKYSIQRSGSDWWVLHDNQWLGFYRGDSWERRPDFINRVEMGGEVFTQGNGVVGPWTDMGNWHLGTSGVAARFQQSWRTSPSSSDYNNDASPSWVDNTATPIVEYITGYFHTDNQGDFRYGGGGAG